MEAISGCVSRGGDFIKDGSFKKRQKKIRFVKPRGETA